MVQRLEEKVQEIKNVNKIDEAEAYRAEAVKSSGELIRLRAEGHEAARAHPGPGSRSVVDQRASVYANGPAAERPARMPEPCAMPTQRASSD